MDCEGLPFGGWSWQLGVMAMLNMHVEEVFEGVAAKASC
jgi:hypothetical protein